MVALQLDSTMNDTMNGVTYYDVTDTDTDYVVYTCGDVNDASDFSEHLKTLGYKSVVVVREVDAKSGASLAWEMVKLWRESQETT